MDKLANYQQIIQQVLEEYGRVKPANGDIQVGICVDSKNHHYQVFHAGWNQHRRIFGPLLHIDLIDDKVWIQYDGTETGVANELVNLGIPKSDIVLAYHAPFMRQYDGFAVG
ncbi:FdxN element excision controlling factor protein [Halomicronema hongdechloris C2206]|uniref:FdxN element excision controlling factor protein n=1 Tax=Halomicronema hongdechloris C2206 TaxID=1641165 RepID=A0A1Z3HMK8_9CYAN|nr:XisI protein [Halomicronema hongdechloris]ASC71543.1 FdxN element excision controlling factor protein [Halomicronema hongdechloris C2206]